MFLLVLLVRRAAVKKEVRQAPPLPQVLSMCDGCPDITVYDDKLVWSCRMEELINFGDWVRAVPVNAKKH